MSSLVQLKQQAIFAAKHGDWEKALAVNQEILEQTPTDIGALNRSGVAYLNLGKVTKAKLAFKTVLDLDATNQLAQKNLVHIKEKTTPNVQFSSQQFIEEPGKTKVVELHRLASKDILTKLHTGTTCVLKTKKRYISVEANGAYIGALPEDLSFRLTKLMDSGNQYSCAVWTVTATTCSIFLKETTRSAENADIASFPCSRSQLTQTDDYDSLILGENYLIDAYPDEPADSEERLLPIE